MRGGAERPPFRIRGVVVWAIAVVVVLIAGDLLGRVVSYSPRRETGVRRLKRPVKSTGLALLHTVTPAPKRSSAPRVWNFHLKPSALRALREHLNVLQIRGGHNQRTRSWIGAQMTVDGETYDVRIKLRGEEHYHGVPPRPSLRVRVRRGGTYRGSRLFNLVEPFDKTADLVYRWEGSEHGLMGWDETMGIVAFNGEPVSVVQYVEQVRRATGDRHARPEGMFFRGTGNHYSEGADPERCGRVVKRVSDWLEDTETVVPFHELREVIDVDLFRWFTALTELSGSGHGFAAFNVKGYCHPVSVKAEFIPWDTMWGALDGLKHTPFAKSGTQFLRDDRYRLIHDGALYELVTSRVEPMLGRLERFHAEYGELLRQDGLFWWPRGTGPGGGSHWMLRRRTGVPTILRDNAAKLRAALEGSHLEWQVDGAKGALLLRTTDRGAKRVTALKLETPAGASEHRLASPIDVPGKFRAHQPVVRARVPGVDPRTIRALIAHNVHTSKPVDAARSQAPLRETPRPVPPVEPGLPPLPEGFVADEAARVVTVGPGVVALESTLQLPRGWSVRVEPGTTLELGEDVLFEIRGGLTMLGEEQSPIVVRGGAQKTWGAVAVLGEPTDRVRVRVAHTRFVGGRGSNAGRVRYTASFAVYYGDVEMTRLTVEGGSADDAINHKYSQVRAIDCTYLNGTGDAVDYDFCNGTDTGTRIDRFADDGLDVSGSDIVVERALITRVGDKGLSVGEKSSARIKDARVFEAFTGCAVKDLSDVQADRLTVAHASAALALYVKKRSFGVPRAMFRELVAIDVKGFAVVDDGATLELDRAARVGEAEPPSAGRLAVTRVVEPDVNTLSYAGLGALADRVRGGLED